jgi:hypothetical protein
MSCKDDCSIHEYSAESTIVDAIGTSRDQVLNTEVTLKTSGVTEQLEYADELEDQPIDIIRSTVRTIDNPCLPVYTYSFFFIFVTK